MRGYTLDTNIISHLLSRKKDSRERLFQRIAQVTLVGYPVTLSALVYYETRRGFIYGEMQDKLMVFEEFCREYQVLACDLPVLNRTCDLWSYIRKNYGKPTGKDVDLIIAATGLVHDMVVVTENTRDFERIPDLKLENWLQVP